MLRLRPSLGQGSRGAGGRAGGKGGRGMAFLGCNYGKGKKHLVLQRKLDQEGRKEGKEWKGVGRKNCLWMGQKEEVER